MQTASQGGSESETQVQAGSDLAGLGKQDRLSAGGGLRSVGLPSEKGSTLLDANRRVAVLTGGGDRPYALGLASALIDEGVGLDFIGSDELDDPSLHRSPLVRFLNLRKEMRANVSAVRKVVRVLLYYLRLAFYSATAKPKLFHLLWNNKFAVFDRTLLMLYYRVLGKQVLLTVHNVNAGWRDGRDTPLNRLTLKIQYQLCNHLFVHTEQMRNELRSSFAVADTKISVIP
ncbi:MAG: glycosyltransferase, partial [Verrucomicrobia bacterium]|nr:glycosyltransferase [Verrucomicrobiota bacterium]